IARIATWEVDAKTNTVKWADIAFDIFDLPKGRVPDKATILNCYKAGPNRDKLLAAIQEQIVYGTSYDLELEIITPLGKHKWVRVIGEADFENGVCKRRFGVFQDITMTKQAEEALNMANEELNAIFNSGYVSIISTDPKGLITHFNHGAEILLQYAAAEMIGVHTPARIHVAEEVIKRGQELSSMYGRSIQGFDVFVEMARQGRHESREWTYVRKDGSRFPVQLIVSAIKNSDGEITGFLGVATDITERKIAEEKMRNYSILESKSKEMEQFAYIASHDLREPLLTIKSYAKLLDEGVGGRLDEDGKIFTRSIINGIARMEELTKGLLEYSRLGQIKPLQPVNCDQVLADVLADLHSLISTTNATITIEPLPLINGYPLELKLLFQNLINNAIKFRKKEVVPIIHIAAHKIDGGWQFTVHDNGIGIAEKSRNKIFAMFQRLHNRDEYEGTGIGLAQCKKIVEMHGGRIWVESEPGQYSTFCFTILS
ncbi:MAG TPA: ATP-binding protein, partial [Chitinophagales bacterium]|nr:ATP-binding protein [Chitinophagales bacterium]